MHKDIIKGSSKVIMRRLQQQWGAFSEEEIAEIQGFYEEQAMKLKIQHRHHREKLKLINTQN